MLDMPHPRSRMVEVHIARRRVRERDVLDVMQALREEFLDPGFEEFTN